MIDLEKMAKEHEKLFPNAMASMVGYIAEAMTVIEKAMKQNS